MKGKKSSLDYTPSQHNYQVWGELMTFSGMQGFKDFTVHEAFLRKLLEEVFPPKRR